MGWHRSSSVFAAGALCYFAVSVKFRFGYDDSLDVVGIHLVGGIVGSVLLGFFADASVNPAGADGVFFGSGGWNLLGEQILAVVVVMAFSFVVTGAILLALRAFLPDGIRVSAEDESQGLDLTQHSETAYSFSERG